MSDPFEPIPNPTPEQALPKPVTEPLCEDVLEATAYTENKKRELSRRLVQSAIPGAGSRQHKDKSSGFMKELGMAAREIIQQVLFLVLLTLRFCAIPPAYLIRKIATPRAQAFLANVEFLGISLKMEDHDGANSSIGVLPTLLAVWKWLSGAAHAGIRTARTLYVLLRLLEQDPDFLNTRRCAKELHSGDVHLRRSKRTSTFSDTVVIYVDDGERPPTASEVYHASLTSTDHLDKVLAAFEAAQCSSGNDEQKEMTSPKALDACEHDKGTVQRCAICAKRHARSKIPRKSASLEPAWRSPGGESQVSLASSTQTTPRKLKKPRRV